MAHYSLSSQNCLTLEESHSQASQPSQLSPGGVFTHWIVYNISSKITSLPEKVEKVERLGNEILQGLNSFGKIGYNGPCPPHGSKHRYYFRIYALDCYIDLPPGATREEILKAIEGHVIGEAELLGYYKR